LHPGKHCKVSVFSSAAQLAQLNKHWGAKWEVMDSNSLERHSEWAAFVLAFTNGSKDILVFSEIIGPVSKLFHCSPHCCS